MSMPTGSAFTARNQALAWAGRRPTGTTVRRAGLAFFAWKGDHRPWSARVKGLNMEVLR
jgi:hypothetical protein